jgi:hypothetical protein
MYEMKYKLTVLVSGFSKLFTTREAAERWATLVLGLEVAAYKVESIQLASADSQVGIGG